MELKEGMEGMYVRTKNLGGSIEKIIEIIPKEKTPDLKTRYITDISKEYGLKVTDDYIIGEPSYNLIDLVEVGDYVNGYKVYSGGKNHFDYIVTWDEERNYYMKIELPSIDIKSIVTKEQFNSMKYEVE